LRRLNFRRDSLEDIFLRAMQDVHVPVSTPAAHAEVTNGHL
jgi:hypothetical protein